MSDVLLRQLPGAWSAQEAGRFTPQPQGDSTNPALDELDRQLLERQAAPEDEKMPEGGSLEDLDREFEERTSSPVKRAGKQLFQGTLAGPAELGGGLGDVYSAGKEFLTQKSQEYGTGAKIAKKYGVPEEPRNPTWYERVARAEGSGLPITALGAYLGGPIGGIASAAAIGGGALAEPYISSLASKLPYHTGPLAQIAAGALLGRKIGKITGGALAKKPITPTEQDFRDSAHAQYDKVDNSGITLEPNIAANETANKTLAKLGPGADVNSPKTVALTKLMQPDPNGSPTDIRKVMATYKALGDVKPPIGKPKGDADYRAAQIARQDIKDYLDNITKSAPYSVVSGHANIPEMYENWTNANGDWAAAERIGTVNRRYEAGLAQAGSTYSGGNAYNAIAQKFRPLVDPLRFNRQFNQEETDFLKNHIVHPGFLQNTMRVLSKVAPNNAFGMWGNMYAGAQALGGSPQYLGLTGLSLLSGAGQRALRLAQKAKLQEFRTLTASRSPLFKKLNPGFVKDEHEIGPGTAGGIGGALEGLEEAVPEYIHQGLDISHEAGGIESDQEKKKKEQGGGYSGLANRLHFATNMAMGRMKATKSGGYDQPTESFADPEAGRLMLARQAARPQTPMQPQAQSPYAAMLSNPQAQTAIGGGQLPYPQFQVAGPTGRAGIGGYGSSPGAPMGQGGYDWFGGDKSKSYRQIVQPPAGQSKYFMGSFSTVSKPHPSKGGASMEAPQEDEDTGGYDDTRLPVSTNVVDRRSYDESKLHWPWTIHANEKRFYPQGDPTFEAPMIPPPVYTGHLGVAAGVNDIPGPAPTVGATGPINVGGYDGVTGFLDRMAAPIVTEHSQPWNVGRVANVLGQALSTMGPKSGVVESAPLADVISPTQYGAPKSNPIVNPQYSTQKGDRLPTANVPWPQVGGYDGEPSIGDQAMTEVAINRAAGTTPRGILQSVLSPTAQDIGQNIGMAMSPIEAYHGSPYDFNAFDSSKIGTGEGAQAYGHGLYFAERPGVASDYKQKLSNPTVNGRPYDVNNPLHKAASIIDEAGSREAAIADVRRRAAHDPGDFYQDVLRHLQSGKPLPKIDSGGKMYQVEIGSEPEHFLDWDKPLSEQSEHVKGALQKNEDVSMHAGAPSFQGSVYEPPSKDWIPHNKTGADFYNDLATGIGREGRTNNPAADATKALQDAGIPGIRYLDQGSRAIDATQQARISKMESDIADLRGKIANPPSWSQRQSGTVEGWKSQLASQQQALDQVKKGLNITHNYVVFDPSIIKIMRKYGILGPVSLAGASGATQKRHSGGYNDASGGGTVQDSTTMFGGYRSKREWGARRGGYSVSPLAGGTSY